MKPNWNDLATKEASQKNCLRAYGKKGIHPCGRKNISSKSWQLQSNIHDSHGFPIWVTWTSVIRYYKMITPFDIIQRINIPNYEIRFHILDQVQRMFFLHNLFDWQSKYIWLVFCKESFLPQRTLSFSFFKANPHSR